jgi:hypothetical protein
MNVSRRGKRRKQPSQMQRLYREFQEFYARERAAWVAEAPEREPWAPRNPRRLFNLAVKGPYRAYRKRMTPWQLLSAMYAVLGRGSAGPDWPGFGAQSRPRPGLFRGFNPAKYHGELPLEDHFANLFKARLWGSLLRSLAPRTDNGRQDPEGRFRGAPEYGLVRQGGQSRTREACSCPPPDGLEDVAGPGEQARGIGRLVETVEEALACLDKVERLIIQLTFWGDLSARGIGVELGVDHKTVQRRRDAALNKLRGFYRDEVGAAA